MNYTDEDIAELADLFTNGPETDTDGHVAVKDIPTTRATILGSIKTEPSTDNRHQAWVMSGLAPSTAVQPSTQGEKETDRNIFSNIWRQPLQDHHPESTSIQASNAGCGSDHLQNPSVKSIPSVNRYPQRQTTPIVNEHSIAHLKSRLQFQNQKASQHRQQQHLQQQQQQQQQCLLQQQQRHRVQQQQQRLKEQQQQHLQEQQQQRLLQQQQQRQQQQQQQCLLQQQQQRSQQQHLQLQQQKQRLHQRQQQCLEQQQQQQQQVLKYQEQQQQQRLQQQHPLLQQQQQHLLQQRLQQQHQHERLLQQQQQQCQGQKHQQQHRLTTTYVDIPRPTSALCHPQERRIAPKMKESFSYRPVASQLSQHQPTVPMPVVQPGTTQWGQPPTASHGDIWQLRPTTHHRSQQHTSRAALINEPQQRLVAELHQQQRLLATNVGAKQHKAADSQLSLPPNKTEHFKQSKEDCRLTTPILDEYKPCVFALEDLRQHEPIYCGEVIVEDVTFTQAEAIALFDKPACKPRTVTEVPQRGLPSHQQQIACGTSQCEVPMNLSNPTLKANADDFQVESSVLKNDMVHTGSFYKKIDSPENPYDLTLQDLDIYQESYEKDAFLTSELCSMENDRGESQSPASVNEAHGEVPMMVKPDDSTPMDISDESECKYITIQPCSSKTMESETDKVFEPSYTAENSAPVHPHNSDQCPEPIVIAPELDHQKENQWFSVEKDILPNYKRGRTSLREERILEFWAQKLGYVLPTKQQLTEVADFLQRRHQFVLIWLNKQLWARSQYQERQKRKGSTSQQQTQFRTILPQANLIPNTVNTTVSCNTVRVEPLLSICEGKVIPPNESNNLITRVNVGQNLEVQPELRISLHESESSSSVDTEHENSPQIPLCKLDRGLRSEGTICGSEIESDASSGEELDQTGQAGVLKEQGQSDSNSDNPQNQPLKSCLGDLEEFVRTETNSEKSCAGTDNVADKAAPIPKHMKKLVLKQKQTIAEKKFRNWMSIHPGNIRPNEEEIEELCDLTNYSIKEVRKFFAKMRMNSHKELWLQNVSVH